MRRALRLFAVWMLVGVVFGLQSLIVMKAAYGERIEWWRPVAMNVLCYVNWWILTPVVLALGRRFPLDTLSWKRSLRVHVPASLLIPTLYLVLCQLTSFRWLRPAMYKPQSTGSEFALSIFGNVHLEILTYWTIVGIQWAARTFVSTANMEARLAEARLQALRVQLQPHFLFNTLNAISALVHEDPETADRMISRLSELLRLTLQSSGRTEVTLREERALAERYLGIEQVRFEERLAVSWRFASDLEEALVPALLLQPLVENAVRHGIAKRSLPGRIDLEAARENGTLVIAVTNDGPPLLKGRVAGVGLSNSEARVTALGGSLSLADVAGRVRAEIRIPYRTGAGGRA
ncbi:MAG: histidine kinase [Thermoanaerobaculia bacterium]